MPEFPAITHVALTVTSLERSVPWYKAIVHSTRFLTRTRFQLQACRLAYGRHHRRVNSVP